MKLLGEGYRKSRSTSRGIELSAFRRGDQSEFLNASNLQAEIRGRKEKNVILFCAYISERKEGEGSVSQSFSFYCNLDIYIYIQRDIYVYIKIYILYYLLVGTTFKFYG